jgi:superfamily II DNA or RNA helicase
MGNSRKVLKGGSNNVSPLRHVENVNLSNLYLEETSPNTMFQPEFYNNVGEPIAQKPSMNLEECHSFYDPCTKYPLANIKELEKRVREIKQSIQRKIDERIELPEEIRTRLDLLMFILNHEKEPDLFLLEYKKGEQTGQIFEAYWDIVFALGLVSRFPVNKNYYMYNGNIDGIRDLNDEKLIQNPLFYLESRGVNMGASGASDITFVYKEEKEILESDPCSFSTKEIQKKPKFIFCSSKLFKNDGKKTIEKYDIQKIYTAAKNLSIDYDYEIVLLVQNREIVLEKIRRAISQYIAEEASAVFGSNDLIQVLRNFYHFVRNGISKEGSLSKEDLRSFLNIQQTIKPILNLRFHQDLAVYKMTNAIRAFQERPSINNKFLVGILPRGGKTYIAAGLVRDLKPKRVVVLLGAKTETLEQFKRDMFEYYQDFSNYTILDVREENANFTLDESKNYIFIMSIELYKKQDSSRQLLIDLKSSPTKRADLFICDEAHLKQVTERAVTEMKKATEKEDEQALKEVDKMISKTVPVVYMTGTYVRPLDAFKIPFENVVIWDYEDLQMGKKLDEDDSYFRNLYGELYEKILTQQIAKGETLETIAKVYKKFPDLHLLTTQFDEKAKVAFSDQGLGKGFATIEQTFRLKKGYDIRTEGPENWYNGFQNPKAVFRIINYLSAPDWDVSINNDYEESTGSVIKSIDRISQRIGDRLAFLSTDFTPHTQIWFLAQSTDRVYSRMPILASAILQNQWFRKHFNILAVSDSRWRKALGKSEFEVPFAEDTGKISLGCLSTDETLKQCILREENAARQQNKGLIILAQKMLQVGISLPCADVVVLLDTGENVDERIQKMFRALTESPYKKAGYIVDMNYFRTVKAIHNYNIKAYQVKKQKRVVTTGESLELFNKILNLYYIDNTSIRPRSKNCLRLLMSQSE